LHRHFVSATLFVDFARVPKGTPLSCKWGGKQFCPEFPSTAWQSYQLLVAMGQCHARPVRWSWSYDSRGWEEIQPPETKTSGVDTAPEELATQPNSSK